MKRTKILYSFFIFLICILFTVGGGVPTLDAKSKGKEKSAQKSKGKGHKNKKGKEWIPPGLTEEEKAEWKDGVPPGWSKGKKTGWGGHSVPPGWSTWKKKNKEKWKKDLADARLRTEKWAEKRSSENDWRKERQKREAESLYISIEGAARAGVPVARVEDLVEKAIKQDMSSEDIERLTRAVAHGVGKGIGADEVVVFTEKILDGEIKEEDIVLGVYRWVAKEVRE